MVCPTDAPSHGSWRGREGREHGRGRRECEGEETREKEEEGGGSVKQKR